MQQINTERQQQASARLPRQLPANIIKETKSPIHQKHVNRNSESAPNRFDKLTGEKQQQWPERRSQTNLDDFDTQRSLSSCPTYSSLSRHSPETRECATQITTLTPTQTIEDNQEISHDSPLPIENNQVLLVDEIPFEEVELMPISSGFGYYPYNYPTTKRIVQPQIVARATQFRNNERDKNRNGFNLNFKTKPNGKLPTPRPTAVKQSPRSDSYILPTKRNEINSKVPKNNSLPRVSRRLPAREPVVRSASPPPGKRRLETTRRNGVARPPPKYLSSPVDQQDLGRKPIRFTNKHNNAYYPSYPPLPRNSSDKSRNVRVANNEYVIRRRRQVPSDYVYDDYYPDNPIERTRPQRVVRVLRDESYLEDDDDYYVEPTPSRRAPVVRRPPPPPQTEYVYLDETPAQIRHRRSRRPEVVYIDEDQPVEYEDDYIYVDEDGNEVDYIYDDDINRRRPHKSRVIYVEDDRSIDQGRIKRKSKQPSSTRIVYE